MSPGLLSGLWLVAVFGVVAWALFTADRAEHETAELRADLLTLIDLLHEAPWCPQSDARDAHVWRAKLEGLFPRAGCQRARADREALYEVHRAEELERRRRAGGRP